MALLFAEVNLVALGKQPMAGPHLYVSPRLGVWWWPASGEDQGLLTGLSLGVRRDCLGDYSYAYSLGLTQAWLNSAFGDEDATVLYISYGATMYFE